MSLSALRQRAQRLKVEALALGLAARHPQTPWYAKLIVAGCVAYAVTPVDLFPDFLPLLGFIDDLVFIPVALAFAVKFIPAPVLADCRGRAEKFSLGMKTRRAWLLFAATWLALAAFSALLALRSL
jgi:uncharacterized membrane protein YkvA (DUF1232 family)